MFSAAPEIISLYDGGLRKGRTPHTGGTIIAESSFCLEWYPACCIRASIKMICYPISIEVGSALTGKS